MPAPCPYIHIIAFLSHQIQLLCQLLKLAAAQTKCLKCKIEVMHLWFFFWDSSDRSQFMKAAKPKKCTMTKKRDKKKGNANTFHIGIWHIFLDYIKLWQIGPLFANRMASHVNWIHSKKRPNWHGYIFFEVYPASQMCCICNGTLHFTLYYSNIAYTYISGLWWC